MKINSMMSMYNNQANNTSNRPPLWKVSGDLNKDHQIDGKEQARMQLLDLNKDGIVGPKEHQRELKLFDKNRDGKIGPRELHNQFNVARNARGDFNRDGRIDPLEKNVVNKYDKNGDHLIGPMERLAQLADWDKNKDGKINPIERFMELISLHREQTQEDTKTKQLNFLA